MGNVYSGNVKKFDYVKDVLMCQEVGLERNARIVFVPKLHVIAVKDESDFIVTGIQMIDLKNL